MLFKFFFFIYLNADCTKRLFKIKTQNINNISCFKFNGCYLFLEFHRLVILPQGRVYGRHVFRLTPQIAPVYHISI